LELRHLRYFVAVADKLKFTEAARSVHIAQPSLSQQIQDLEKDIGVTLIERNNRQVRLTPAGEHFLKDAQRILLQAEEARQSALKIDRGELGHCRVGFLFPAIRRGMAKVIEQYRLLYPHVRLSMGHFSPAEQLTMLETNQLDVIFTRTYNQRAHPDLRSDVVANDTLLAVVHPDHPLARQSVVKLSQLGTQPVVIFNRDIAPTFYDMVIGFCGAQNVAPQGQYRDPYVMDTIVLMVESGLGVGIVPGCVQHLRHSACHFLPFDVTPPAVELIMAVRKDNQQNPIITAFTDLVKQYKHHF
jgi:DNA-binding transcriptional LysR family regulator